MFEARDAAVEFFRAAFFATGFFAAPGGFATLGFAAGATVCAEAENTGPKAHDSATAIAIDLAKDAALALTLLVAINEKENDLGWLFKIRLRMKTLKSLTKLNSCVSSTRA